MLGDSTALGAARKGREARRQGKPRMFAGVEFWMAPGNFRSPSQDELCELIEEAGGRLVDSPYGGERAGEGGEHGAWVAPRRGAAQSHGDAAWRGVAWSGAVSWRRGVARRRGVGLQLAGVSWRQDAAQQPEPGAGRRADRGVRGGEKSRHLPRARQRQV